MWTAQVVRSWKLSIRYLVRSAHRYTSIYLLFDSTVCTQVRGYLNDSSIVRAEAHTPSHAFLHMSPQDRVRPLTCRSSRQRPDVQEMHSRVAELWRALNTVVPSMPSALVDGPAGEPPKAAATLCWDAGRCLCGREGVLMIYYTPTIVVMGVWGWDSGPVVVWVWDMWIGCAVGGP